MNNAIYFGLTLTLLSTACNPPPDAVKFYGTEWQTTAFRLMDPDTCVPQRLIDDLDIMRENVKHVEGSDWWFNVDIEIYRHDHIFKEWFGDNPEWVLALHFRGQSLIKTRRVHSHVIAHEIAHEAMNVEGLGQSPENTMHKGKFLIYERMLQSGLERVDDHIDPCTNRPYAD